MYLKIIFSFSFKNDCLMSIDQLHLLDPQHFSESSQKSWCFRSCGPRTGSTTPARRWPEPSGRGSTYPQNIQDSWGKDLLMFHVLLHSNKFFIYDFPKNFKNILSFDFLQMSYTIKQSKLNSQPFEIFLDDGNKNYDRNQSSFKL